MARYSMQVGLSPEEVIARAKVFFGPGGFGLQVSDEQQEGCCITLTGGGGHVWVNARVEGQKTTVELETREWDHQVLEFMRKIG